MPEFVQVVIDIQGDEEDENIKPEGGGSAASGRARASSERITETRGGVLLRTLALAAILALQPATAQPQAPNWGSPPEMDCIPQTTNDRFKGSTTVATSDPPLELYELHPRLYATRTKEGVLSIAMVFSGYFRDWQYLRCHDVAFLVDGEPMEPVAVDHRGDVRSSGVFETIVAALSPESAAKLAQAKVLEWRVCRTEAKASTQFLCDAKGWWKVVENLRQEKVQP